MNTKKINVLKKAVQMLENGFNYDWTSTKRCNCGLVVAALGVKESVHNAGRGLWSQKVESAECPITGLRICDIQKALLENGFVKSEIVDLENLSDVNVRNRAGLTGNRLPQAEFPDTYLNRSDKNALLAYLRAWVELLTEEMEQQRETARELLKDKPAIRYIAIKVDNSIFEQAKELIKN